eukprot:scaffold301_cov243-Pinguiococcus_pyrenoidosus.AAC.159
MGALGRLLRSACAALRFSASNNACCCPGVSLGVLGAEGCMMGAEGDGTPRFIMACSNVVPLGSAIF